MKFKIISTVTAVTVTGVFLTALAFAKADAPTLSTPTEVSPPGEAEAEAEREDGFWVCDYDGFIAVFHSADRSVPIEVTSITTHNLRYNDQDMLREGVYISDYMDVVRFLEDFCP